MRQAGYLAAAGIYALDHHVERLAEDHAKARAFGDELRRLSYIDDILPVETNIVIFRIGPASRRKTSSPTSAAAAFSL